MKKVLALALAFALVLSLGMSAVAAKWSDEQFKDWADVGASYKADVQRLAVHDEGLNVFQGDTAGNFNPQKTFTRAELVAIVALIDKGGYDVSLLADGDALNKMFATDAQRGEKFADVSKDDWYFAVVNYAAFNGYIEGDGTGNFKPDATVTSDMLYSFVLSLLGFQKDDMNGADWVGKVNSIIRLYGLSFNVAKDYNVTREQVAAVLSKAVDTTKYFRDNQNNTYKKVMDGTTEVKLLTNFTGAKQKEAGAITIEGKVIKTKYAALEGAGGYPDNSVVIWQPNTTPTNGGSGTIWQIDDPSDDFVPTKYLGREVKVDVVRTSTSGNSHYRQANGAKAEPLHNNDIAKIGWRDGNTNYNTFTADFATATYNVNRNIGWGNLYNWTNRNAQPIRGAYLDFSGTRLGTDDTLASSWELTKTTGVNNNNWTAFTAGNWNYAYAVRDVNVNAYTEVFYLNYIALEIGATTRGVTELLWLDGCHFADQKLGDIEFGTTAAKGDVVVGVMNKDRNGLVTLEVIEAKNGTKHLGTNSADIDGARYERSNIWGGLIAADFQKLSNTTAYGYYVAAPAYASVPGVDFSPLNGDNVLGVFWSDRVNKQFKTDGLNGHQENDVRLDYAANTATELPAIGSGQAVKYRLFSTSFNDSQSVGNINSNPMIYGTSAADRFLDGANWFTDSRDLDINGAAAQGQRVVAVVYNVANGDIVRWAYSDVINARATTVRNITIWAANNGGVITPNTNGNYRNVNVAVPAGINALQLTLTKVAGQSISVTNISSAAAAKTVVWDNNVPNTTTATISLANLANGDSRTFDVIVSEGNLAQLTYRVNVTVDGGTPSPGAGTLIIADGTYKVVAAPTAAAGEVSYNGMGGVYNHSNTTTYTTDAALVALVQALPANAVFTVLNGKVTEITSGNASFVVDTNIASVLAGTVKLQTNHNTAFEVVAAGALNLGTSFELYAAGTSNTFDVDSLVTTGTITVKAQMGALVAAGRTIIVDLPAHATALTITSASAVTVTQGTVTLPTALLSVTITNASGTATGNVPADTTHAASTWSGSTVTLGNAGNYSGSGKVNVTVKNSANQTIATIAYSLTTANPGVVSDLIVTTQIPA